MKLITKVAAAQPLKLPRIGVLVEVLNQVLPELYAEMDSERPELSATAEILVDHFSDMPPETKLFRTFSTRDPFKAVNPALLKMTGSVAEQIKNVASAAGFTEPDAFKHLVNIVMGEALHIAFYGEIRKDPKAMLSAIVERQIDGALYKTAALPKATLPNVDKKHEGPGKKRRDPARYRIPEAKAPAFSDMIDLYASLAYNTAFNALVTAPTVLASGEETATTIAHLKSQLAINFENHHFLSLAHKELKNQLASGRKLFARGNPLSPNPSIGAFFGATHDDWFGSEEDGNLNKYRPESIMQLFANGSIENPKVGYLPGNILSRKALYSKENPNMIIEAWDGRAATISTKVLSNKYMDNESKFKTDMEKTLIQGFETNLALLRGNGIPLAKYKNILGINDEALMTATKEALIKILARLPTKMEVGPENEKVQMKLAQISDICERAIDAERADFVAKVNAKNPAFVAANPDFKDFLGAAAQLALRLPIAFAKKFEGFNPMGTLPPLPRQKETKLGDIHPGIQKFFGEYANTSFTDLMSSLSPSYRGMSGTTNIVNILGNSKDDTVSFFGNARKISDARKQGVEADGRTRTAFIEKLTFLYNRIEENVMKMPEPKLEQGTGSAARQEKESIRSLISELRKNETTKNQLVAVLFAAALDSIGVPFSAVPVGSLIQAMQTKDNSAAAIFQIAEAVSNALPAEVNNSAESMVESKYSNISEYKKNNPAILEKDDVELKLNDNHTSTRAALMFEGSMLNGLRVMMSNAYVARFDQNAKADSDFIKNNYREDIPTEVELMRAKALEDAATTLEASGILAKLGLDFDIKENKVEPYDKNKPKGFSDAERQRQNSVGNKFQLFFESNSRESLKAKLRTLGLDPDVNIDPLVILLARRMHTLFSNEFERKLELSNLGVRAGTAAGISDTERAQAKEMQSSSLDEDETPDAGRTAEQNEFVQFASDWGTKIRFHQSGGLSTQCLAGFLSETLAKNDLSKKDGLDGEWARRYRDAFDTSGKPKGGKTLPPIIGLAANRVAWAYGKVNHDSNIEQLNILFAQQSALGKKPSTLAELTVMEKIPFDPIYASKVYMGGRTTDKAAQTYRILRRTRVDGTANFEDFLIDFRSAVQNFEREIDVAIADLPSLEAKDLCNRIIAESKATTNPMWAPKPEDIEMLRNLGLEMSATGQVRDERLWKMAFASNEGLNMVSTFVKSVLKTKDDAKVKAIVGTVKNSRLVKTTWQKGMDDVLGKTGLLDKDDTEKLSISLGALKAALEDNVDFIAMSSSEQEELAKREMQVLEAQEADTEMAEAVERKIITADTKMSSLMEGFVRADPDLQAIQIAIQGDLDIYDDVFNASATDAEVMRSAAQKYYTIEQLARTNAVLLDKEASAFVMQITDGIDEDDLDKEMDALLSTSSKNLYAKFAKLAPKYFPALNQRINEKLSLLKTEVLRLIEASESEEKGQGAVKFARDLQKKTAHLATYQGWVEEGKDICLAQVPKLPKVGRYKKTFEGFVDYNETRIKNWLKRLRNDNLILGLDIIDEELREENKSILDIKEDDLADVLANDQEAFALSKDSIIKSLFATKTQVLNKLKQVNQTKTTLADIKDEDFEKFEAQYEEAAKALSDTFKQELGMPLNKMVISDSSEDDDLELIEDDEFDLSDEDITEDEFTEVELDLTDKERGQRANSALSLQKMVGAVQALLMRPKMHPIYRRVGKEFAKDLLDIVSDINFTSKFNHIQMNAATEVLRKATTEMISAGESLVASEDTPDLYEKAADDAVDFFEKKLNDIEIALGAREEKVTNIKVDLKPQNQTDPSKPPLPSREQRLNSELVSSMKKVDDAIELSEKDSKEAIALGNVRVLLNALMPENRVMGPTVDSKAIIAMVESIVSLIDSDTLYSATPDVMEKLMAKLRAVGISTRIPVNFVPLEAPVAKDVHDTAKELFNDIKKLNQQIGGYILKVPEEAHQYIAAIDIHFEEMDEVMEKVEEKRAFNILSQDDMQLMETIKTVMGMIVNDLRNARSAQDFAKFDSDRSLIIEPAENIVNLFGDLKDKVLQDLKAKKASWLSPKKISGKWVI